MGCRTAWHVGRPAGSRQNRRAFTTPSPLPLPRSNPKLRVLNNNKGALTYNRCTNCNLSELKCKVLRQGGGRRQPMGMQSGAPAMGWVCGCAPNAALHVKAGVSHSGRTRRSMPRPTARRADPLPLPLPRRRMRGRAPPAPTAHWTAAPSAPPASTWPLFQSSTLMPPAAPPRPQPRTTPAASRALRPFSARPAPHATPVSGAGPGAAAVRRLWEN